MPSRISKIRWPAYSEIAGFCPRYSMRIMASGAMVLAHTPAWISPTFTRHRPSSWGAMLWMFNAAEQAASRAFFPSWEAPQGWAAFPSR